MNLPYLSPNNFWLIVGVLIGASFTVLGVYVEHRLQIRRGRLKEKADKEAREEERREKIRLDLLRKDPPQLSQTRVRWHFDGFDENTEVPSAPSKDAPSTTPKDQNTGKLGNEIASFGSPDSYIKHQDTNTEDEQNGPETKEHPPE